MALSQSGKPGGTVTRLEDARKKRKKSTANASTGKKGEVDDLDAQSRTSNRRFDKVKVERIKADIASGKYRIDYMQVADKFIEHERYG